MSTLVTAPVADPAGGTAGILRRRRRTSARFAALVVGLVLLVVVLYAVSLCVGNTVYTPAQVLAVILGEPVPGASFTVGELRLPRATTAVLCGLAFGVAGASFQTLLRNVLASPDIIGITAGANTAAVFGIMVLGLSGTSLSTLAVAGGLVTALAIAVLAWRDGVSPTRLILIGIGVDAMLTSVTSWLLVRGDQWDIQTASRWLTGSLNGAEWARAVPLAVCVVLGLPAIGLLARRLDVLRLGTDAARALGVHVEATRLTTIVVAVVLLALATATAGPIAFVSFLAGPIALRLVGPARSALLPAGLVGAALVLAADLVAQHLLPTQLPVGVVTGVIGGPLLLWLTVRMTRKEGLS